MNERDIFIGRWKAFERGSGGIDMPIHQVKDGQIADLIINPDGTGYTEKKKKFGGVKRESFTWKEGIITYDDAPEKDSCYLISMDFEGMYFIVIRPIDPSFMIAIMHVNSGLSGIDGMNIKFRKVS